MNIKMPFKALSALYKAKREIRHRDEVRSKEEGIQQTESSPLAKMLSRPEDYRLEAYFEGDSLSVLIRPKESALEVPYEIVTKEVPKKTTYRLDPKKVKETYANREVCIAYNERS